jgi:chorismate-pyruvate lyase
VQRRAVIGVSRLPTPLVRAQSLLASGRLPGSFAELLRTRGVGTALAATNAEFRRELLWSAAGPE